MKFSYFTIVSAAILNCNIMQADICTADNRGFSANAYPTYATWQDNVYFPINYHKIFSKEVFGNSLELENGSIWQIRPEDAKKVARNWRSNDFVLITPCFCANYMGYPFYMTNQRTGSYVYVTLRNSPIVDAPATTTVVSIDPITGKIILRDGKNVDYFFQISPEDIFIVNQWALGQMVIIGSNNNPYLTFKDHSDCILINTDFSKDHYIRASQN